MKPESVLQDAMEEKKVCIVIPNYNGAAYLADCLSSLRAQTMPARILVVDNGSADGSADMIRDGFPEAELICLPENTGFCGAVNRGIQSAADDEYVILLNNDTKAAPDFVRALVRAMEEEPRAFSAQARMCRMNEPGVIDDAGDYYCALGWAFADGKGKADGERYRRKKKIFSSCGGAAIYRKSILDAIGDFDENHFAYLEDLDIGWRARIQGYVNLYAPDALVYHVGSAASGSAHNLFKVTHSSRNSVYVLLKNMPLWQLILNAPFLLLGFVVKQVFFALKGYGRVYFLGLGEGVALYAKGKKEGRKVKFRFRDLPHSLRIQWELWCNLFRRVFLFFL